MRVPEPPLALLQWSLLLAGFAMMFAGKDGEAWTAFVGAIVLSGVSSALRQMGASD